MPRPEIFKVQLPLSSSEVEPMALIYNEDRSIEVMIPAKDVAPLVHHEPKSFWLALVKNGRVALIKEASWQDW